MLVRIVAEGYQLDMRRRIRGNNVGGVPVTFGDEKAEAETPPS